MATALKRGLSLTTLVLIIVLINQEKSVRCQRRGTKTGSVIVINNHGGSRGGCPAYGGGGGGESSGATTVVKTSKKGHTIIIKGPGSKKSKKAEEPEHIPVPVHVPIDHGHGYGGHETKMAPVFVPSDQPLAPMLMMAHPNMAVNNQASNQQMQHAMQQQYMQQQHSNQDGHQQWTPVATVSHPVFAPANSGEQSQTNISNDYNTFNQIQNRNMEPGSQMQTSETGNVPSHSHPFQGMYPREQLLQQANIVKEKYGQDKRDDKEENQKQEISQKQQQQQLNQQHQFSHPQYPQFLPPNFLPPYPGVPMSMGQMPMGAGFPISGVPMGGFPMNAMPTNEIHMNGIQMHPIHFQPQPQGPQLQIAIEPQAQLHPVFQPDNDNYGFQSPMGYESSQWPVIDQSQSMGEWLGQLLWRKKKKK